MSPDPTEIAISAVTGGASAFAVLKVALSRAEKDIAGLYVTLHHQYHREREYAIKLEGRLTAIEGRIEHLEDRK